MSKESTDRYSASLSDFQLLPPSTHIEQHANGLELERRSILYEDQLPELYNCLPPLPQQDSSDLEPRQNSDSISIESRDSNVTVERDLEPFREIHQVNSNGVPFSLVTGVQSLEPPEPELEPEPQLELELVEEAEEGEVPPESVRPPTRPNLRPQSSGRQSQISASSRSNRAQHRSPRHHSDRRKRYRKQQKPKNPFSTVQRQFKALSHSLDVKLLAASPNSALNPKRLDRCRAAMAHAESKPIASGGGMHVSIKLAEPHLFLAGFDHHGRRRGRRSEPGMAFLRGTLKLDVSKPIKVKSISLRLNGTGRIDWPGISVTANGRRRDHEVLQSLSQELKFFDNSIPTWETEWGVACAYNPAEPTADLHSHGPNLGHYRHHRLSLLPDTASISSGSGSTPPPSIRSRELKRVSIMSHTRSRSVDKNHRKSAPLADVHREYKRFQPGVYEYPFEIPVDYKFCETVNLPQGYLNWQLTADIARSGPFKPNIHGSREVSIVRIPDMMSVEVSEPVAIRKTWDDQLFYEMILSGRTFAIGSKLPIMLRLQPLDKRMQLLKIRVYIAESIEYISKYIDPHTNAPIRRKEPRRMFMAFEKLAGYPVDSNRFPGSSVSYHRGGEVSDPELRTAHRAAARQRETLPNDYDSSHNRHRVNNILGELDLGLEELWEDTEMDLNVQIPTCQIMARRPEMTVHPECSWTRFNVQHWIRVVLRVVKRENTNPTAYKNQYEITIESPIMLTNCRTNEMALPRYERDSDPNVRSQPTRTCGCPDAPFVNKKAPEPIMILGLEPKTTVVSAVRPVSDAMINWPSPPDAVVSPGSRRSSRAPSYRARPFGDLTIDTNMPPTPMDDDITEANGVPLPPGARTPTMATPGLPPRYDVVVGTPSVDGLADYFSRLHSYEDAHSDGHHTEPKGDPAATVQEYDSDDSGETEERLVERGGRVNVRNPLSPGLAGRSRSFELVRRPGLGILEEESS